MINLVFTRKRFFCPGKGREVEVDFLAQMRKPGDLLGVKFCSAFKAGEKMDCHKFCLRLPQAQVAPPLSYYPLSLTEEVRRTTVLHTEEILENIVQLAELLDEEALGPLSNLAFLELAKSISISQASPPRQDEEG